MNLEQLKAVLWLRWRLTVNQIKRQGKIWAVIVGIIFWLGMLAAVSSFFGAVTFGVYLSSKLGPHSWMFLWDALIVGFLFMWVFGLMLELQRTELLSLHKLLHLPVSLQGVFVCNYLTSLISVTIAIFLPVMCGLAAALIATKGVTMVLLLPLIATFILLVTTVTYQFQGWLVTLMLNPRRRRAIIATFSMCIILGSQLPNLVNIYVQRTMRLDREKQIPEAAFAEDFNRRVAAGQAKPESFQQELATFKDEQSKRRAAEKEKLFKRVQSIGSTVNASLPITWLPYGVKAAAEGKVLPGLLGCLGAAIISIASLRRSYRTAMRLYTGAISAKQTAKVRVPAAVSGKVARYANMIERPWPWVSEQAATVAWTNIRSLSRSPEMRLLLFAPLIAPIIIASLILAQGRNVIPAVFEPLIMLSCIAIPVMVVAQLLQNQFGADRAGFRAMVLTSIPRREILLGKNLSLSMLTFALGGVILLSMQVLLVIPAAHLLALMLQLVSTHFIYCMIGNMVSIWFPAAVAGGSLKPANANTKVILAHVTFGLLFPLIWLPALGAYGLHVLGEKFFFDPRVPTFMLLSALQVALTLGCYRLALNWQGRKLQEREQTIIQAVAERPE